MRDSTSDLQKKFRNTFCFLELNGKKHLAEYTDDNGEDAFYFKSPEFGEILIDRETVDQSLTYYFPENGLYNVQGQAIDFVRYPERQWKRAPYRENCRIVPILSAIGIALGRVNEINLHNLEEIYSGIYPQSLEKAVASLKYSIAVNREFAISKTTTSEKDQLLFWFKSQPIGTLDIKSKKIEIIFQPLYQEAQDFINKQEPSWLLTKKQL